MRQQCVREEWKPRSQSIDYTRQSRTSAKKSQKGQQTYASNDNTVIIEDYCEEGLQHPLQEKNFMSESNQKGSGAKKGEQQCTFHPMINLKSNKLAKRDRSINTYDKLYENGKITRTKILLARELKEQNEIDKYTFHPHLNRLSLMIASEVKKRNYSTKKRVQAQDTNCTFTPKLLSKSLEISKGKPSLIERSSSKNQHQTSKYIKKHLDGNATHLNRTSELIIEHKKKKIFEQLFDILDGDRDGQISCDKIVIEHLQEKYIVMLVPLFHEMINLNAVLKKPDFCDAICRLYKDLTVTQKNQLLNFNRAAKKKHTPTPSASKDSAQQFAATTASLRTAASSTHQSKESTAKKPAMQAPIAQLSSQQIALPQQQQQQPLFAGSSNLFANILKQKCIQQQLDQSQQFK